MRDNHAGGYGVTPELTRGRIYKMRAERASASPTNAQDDELRLLTDRSQLSHVAHLVRRLEFERFVERSAFRGCVQHEVRHTGRAGTGDHVFQDQLRQAAPPPGPFREDVQDDSLRAGHDLGALRATPDSGHRVSQLQSGPGDDFVGRRMRCGEPGKVFTGWERRLEEAARGGGHQLALVVGEPVNVPEHLDALVHHRGHVGERGSADEESGGHVRITLRGWRILAKRVRQRHGAREIQGRRPHSGPGKTRIPLHVTNVCIRY